MAKQSQVKSKRKLLNPVFHLQTKKEEDTLLTRGLIKIVRRTGQLNLSGRNLANGPYLLLILVGFGVKMCSFKCQTKCSVCTSWIKRKCKLR